MGFADKYLKRCNPSVFSLLNSSDKMAADIVVTIPAFNEPEIESCILNLCDCEAPKISILLLVLFNSGERASEKEVEVNRAGKRRLEQLMGEGRVPHWLQLVVGNVENVKHKKAGVGYARKVLMDNAVRFLNERDNSDGLMVSLDADCRVSKNYFMVLESYLKDTKTPFYTHYFEHPLDQDLSLNRGIIAYELHLRYYVEALRSIGFPYAFHTVGSAFSVRAYAYVKQGGMNDRKAGEDFYFLQKLTPLGEPKAINDLTVYPGVRLSDRVPFGTGPMLKKWEEGSANLDLSYPIEAFKPIGLFFKHLDDFYTEVWSMDLLPPLMRVFLEEREEIEKLNQLRQNCSTLKVFRRRFFHLFDAFWILKCLNFFVDQGYDKQETMAGLTKLGIVNNNESMLEALQILRKKQKLEII